MKGPRSGQEIELALGPWSPRGEARTPHDGTEVRVLGGIPGERARVRVTGRSKGGPVAWATISEIVEASPARRIPPCVLEGRCGGCGIQHVNDDAQLDLIVASALTDLPPSVARALAPRSEWIDSAGFGWRHKAVWIPRWRSRLQLGGYARGTHEVIDLPDCGVLAPALSRTRQRLISHLEPLVARGELGLRPPGTPASPSPVPSLRALVGRAARSGDVLLTAVVTAPSPVLESALRAAVQDGDVSGAFIHVHDRDGDGVTGHEPAVLVAGCASLDEEIGGVPLSLGPLSFFQVNPDVLDQMVLRLRAIIGRPAALADVYCGVGALGLAVVGLGGTTEIVGCDVVDEAVAAAQASADAAGFHARYVVGPPERALAGARADVALLDPPRKGCTAAAMQAVLATGVTRVVHVACATTSLARDAERLEERGLRCVGLWPARMIPQTPHIEWIAAFEQPGSSAP